MTALTPSLGPKVSPQDYVEIVDYYARQMHLLDGLDLAAYADTFTLDAVVDHVHNGHRLAGRAAMMEYMEAALPRYLMVVVRHWFDHLIIEPVDAGWTVDYYSLVTRTDAAGAVQFEPTFSVRDQLVRTGHGGILTRERIIHQDSPSRPTAS